MSTEPVWVRYGEWSGWLVAGSVPAAKLLGGDFWSQAARVVCAADGAYVDRVQCYDAGIVTATPFVFTAANGTLAHLFATLPPTVLEAKLDAVAVARNVGLQARMQSAVFARGFHALDQRELREVFLGGSDGTNWTDDARKVALQWVVGIHRVLADSAAWRAIAIAAAPLLRAHITPDIAQSLAFVGQQPPSLAELRRAAACFVAFSVFNRKGATRLLRATGPDAHRMVAIAQRTGAWPDTFAQRANRVRVALDAETW